MRDVKGSYYKVRTEKTIRNLKEHGFNAVFVQTAKEAKDTILDMISTDMSVGVGGSVTVRSIGVIEELKARGNVVFDHWQDGLTPEESLEIRRAQLTSDIFLSSTNAITLSGVLVNIDGCGNRVASMMFGPKKVIVVAGVNKIAENIEDGIKRVRNVAAPLNSIRLNKKNSCNYTGTCGDCKTTDRICKITTIIERKPDFTDFDVVLVGEDLGY